MNTPTSSELATFQVLANREFVNMNRPPPGGEAEDEIDLENFEEEEEFLEEVAPQQEVLVADSPRSEASLPSLPQPERAQERAPAPVPKYDTKSEIEAEKEALLTEIHAMEQQGVKLVRPLSMSDSLEEIQFQYDRMQSDQNAVQMVDIAKQGIKMGSGMVEMSLKKVGFGAIDGYHKNLCADMGKFNRPLNRLYKKYWRRGGMSPEAELGMIVFGSMAWTVVQNKMSGKDIFTSTEKEEKKADFKPPAMPSMNIPASWDDENSKAKEAFEAKERQLANALAASEARERALQAQIQAKEEELPSKRVMIATPVKSSSKKKTAALNLDD